MSQERAGRVWHFVINGRPTPKGSRATGRTAAGRSINYESNPRVRGWMREATAQLIDHAPTEPLQPPYHITVLFEYARPKRPTYDYPSQGDIDKTLRALLDVLGPGSSKPNGQKYAGIITDDRHVTSVDCLKRWGDTDRTVLVIVEGAA